jgi:hypothetical protein
MKIFRIRGKLLIFKPSTFEWPPNYCIQAESVPVQCKLRLKKCIFTNSGQEVLIKNFLMADIYVYI